MKPQLDSGVAVSQPISVMSWLPQVSENWFFQ